jgi:small subunit ribosomal protein S2
LVVAITEEVVSSSEIGVRELLDAGLHFGHQTKRWNPKMQPFIFDKRNGIHIIDLAQSLSQLKVAQKFVYDLIASGYHVLFVGTKKQAQEATKEAAQKTGQYCVTHRWLGGTLTNNPTVRLRIKRMRTLEAMEKDGQFESLPKKEVARLRHELEKLQKNLSGIANMEEMPRALFIVDVNREGIAVKEANRLHIPVIAIVDTNCDPDPIDYPIPGNDDAIRAIRVVLQSLTNTILQAQTEYSKNSVEINQRKAEFAAADAAAAAEIAPKKEERRSRGPRKPGGSGAPGARAPRKRTTGDAPKDETAPAATGTETPTA